MVKKRKRKETCAICGDTGQVTDDHVPPKCIFGKPLPGNLVEVPACFKCNNGDSEYDDIFKVYLSMHCAGSHIRAENLFKKHTLRTLNRNQKLKRKISNDIKPKELVTKSGIFYKKAHCLKWDSQANDAHDIVLERTVRGLYYHHFNKDILGSKAKVRIHWYNNLTKEMHKIAERLHFNSFGHKDEFIYGYLRAEESPLHSIWMFQFFNSHWAGGLTEPI